MWGGEGVTRKYNYVLVSVWERTRVVKGGSWYETS